MLRPFHRCWVTAKTPSHRETQAEEVPPVFHVVSALVPEDKAGKNTAPTSRAQDSQRPATARDGTVSQQGEPPSPQLHRYSPSYHQTSTDAKIQHLMHRREMGFAYLEHLFLPLSLPKPLCPRTSCSWGITSSKRVIKYQSTKTARKCPLAGRYCG